MRRICYYCENRWTTECSKCSWPEGMKYPTGYKGRKFDDMTGLDEVI